MTDAWTNLVVVVTAVTTILLFLSGLQIILKIYQRSSSQGYAVTPFMACFVSCTLWLRYGILLKDPTMILINLVGAIIEFFYVIVFYINTKQRTTIHPTVFGLLLFLLSALTYSKYIAGAGEVLVQRTGLICAGFNIINYAAPLSSTVEVIKTKSTKNLSFIMSFVYFLVACEWCVYGIIYQDQFIKIPNICGIVFGVIQLGLFVLYPASRQRTLSKEKASNYAWQS